MSSGYRQAGSDGPNHEPSGPLHFTPAVAPHAHRLAESRLLWINPASGWWRDAQVQELQRIMRRGDLLVVNDAATLPASLPARTEAGTGIEIRLAAEREDGLWDAVLFGEGDWRNRTEDRPAPPSLGPGDALELEGSFRAFIVRVSSVSRRLVRIRFDQEGAALWEMLYRVGKPVQYSHLARPLDLWEVQTPYAARPWAVEPPSAGLSLTWETLGRLRMKGVRLAGITHAAGLSATGDASLDAALPLPERYEVPEATVSAIEEARLGGGRVVAVGTTVVRALEGNAEARNGRLVAGGGVTGLRVESGFRRRVVDGLLTGIHEPGTSHYDLLLAFAGRTLIERALTHAAGAGYLTHEFGDLCLILEEKDQQTTLAAELKARAQTAADR